MPTDTDALLVLSDLNQKDRIQILLSEYSALRAEIIARTNLGFQIAAVALGGITWFAQQQMSGRPWYFWAIMIFVVVCFFIAIFVDARDLLRAAYRVADIECEVNSRAGEHLLIWENLGGVGGRVNLVISFFSMVKTLPRCKLQPLDRTYLDRDVAIAKEKATAS